MRVQDRGKKLESKQPPAKFRSASQFFPIASYPEEFLQE